MTDLPDLFPGYASHWVSTSIGKMFVRQSTGGKPPLLLLHGYPQTHAMWHRVAPALASQFTLVMPDLPGYGWSAVPKPDAEHAPYDKRAMAGVMIEVMQELGFVRFGLVGHDRGGRVAYRLALDHPGRVERLALLDIVPTLAMWHAMDRSLAMKVWHWPFLAQPHPLPETLIGAAPVTFWNLLAPNWTARKDLSAFDPGALAHYHAFFQDPLRIRATCEDYRAGRTVDLAHDEADAAAGKTIGCPVLALWGEAGIPSGGASPLDAWRGFAPDLRGAAIASGHFLCEENPAATAAALSDFFAGAPPA